MRKQMLTTILSVLILIFVLAACGGEDTSHADTSTNDDTTTSTNTTANDDTTTDDSANDSDSQAAPVAVSVDDLPDHGLEEGGYTLTIVGDLEAGAGYTGTRRNPVAYDPFTRGTNTEGPSDVTMRWDGVIDGERVDLNVTLVFREDITTGTHPIGSSINGDSTFRVRAYVDVDAVGGDDFNKNVMGAVTLDSINRQYANGVFEFTASNEGGQTVTVSGAFHAIPFDRQPESDLSFTGVLGDDDTMTSLGTSSEVRDDGRYSIRFLYRSADDSGGLILLMPSDITTGTHQVGTDQTVGAVWGHATVTGTLELTEVGEHFSGSLNLTVTSDAGESGITGTFNAMPGLSGE